MGTPRRVVRDRRYWMWVVVGVFGGLLYYAVFVWTFPEDRLDGGFSSVIAVMVGWMVGDSTGSAVQARVKVLRRALLGAGLGFGAGLFVMVASARGWIPAVVEPFVTGSILGQGRLSDAVLRWAAFGAVCGIVRAGDVAVGRPLLRKWRKERTRESGSVPDS